MDQNSCQNRTTCSKSNIYHRLNCLEKNCSTKVPFLTKTMFCGSLYSSPIKEYNMECILCKQGDVLKPYITCVLTQSLVATPLCKLKMFSPSPLSFSKYLFLEAHHLKLELAWWRHGLAMSVNLRLEKKLQGDLKKAQTLCCMWWHSAASPERAIWVIWVWEKYLSFHFDTLRVAFFW